MPQAPTAALLLRLPPPQPLRLRPLTFLLLPLTTWVITLSGLAQVAAPTPVVPALAVVAAQEVLAPSQLPPLLLLLLPQSVLA